MDAEFVYAAGASTTIKNAICIHEEAGILFKHMDFRDYSVIVTGGDKIPRASLTHTPRTQAKIHRLGVLKYIQVSIRTTINTFSVYDLMPTLKNPTTPSSKPTQLGDREMLAAAKKQSRKCFLCEETKVHNSAGCHGSYDAATSRSWEVANTSKLNPHSKKPVSYKLVIREVPALLPKGGGLVWNRAGFARHAVRVTKYAGDQLYPAGRHVPQTSGIPSPSPGLPTWIAQASCSSSDSSIENADIVLWHTFGMTHFPSREDFPIMPAEPISLLLRPRNFFGRNPVLDVKPSWARSPSQVAAGTEGPCCGAGKGKRGIGLVDLREEMNGFVWVASAGMGRWLFQPL
ncbi:hypothetical protein GX48_01714 [Paracoccidioides brasiliensis]|nr:hypothetical protein GX48_01714 [Paracoccidioides brasiliensis]